MNLKVKPVFFETDKEKAESILKRVKEILPPHVDLIPEAFLSSWEDLPDFQESLEGTDAILELTENLRPVPIRLFLRLGDFGLPLVLFRGDFYVTARRLEAAGYWKSRGVRVHLALTGADLRDHLALLAAKHRIENTRALLIGSRFQSPYVVTSSPDFTLARRVLGVEIDSCDTATYLASYGAMEEHQVASLVQEWMTEAERIVEPAPEDLRKSARFYLAMKHLLGEFSAEAVAINCLPFLEKIQGTPCMALARLNDEGIPAACEGDLTALMTMIFLERLAGRPGFLGNIISVNPAENVMEINHCVFPLRMSGYDQPRKPYTLRDYHGRGMGVCAACEPDVGIPVTISRLDTDFREMVFLKGQLLSCGEDYCRTNLRVKIQDARAFIRQVRGNHHILVYGDHAKGIADLCHEFGITPVSVG
jgi:L-fucose isomerase-like protein